MQSNVTRKIRSKIRIRSRSGGGTVAAALPPHAGHSTTAHGISTETHFAKASAPTSETTRFQDDELCCRRDQRLRCDPRYRARGSGQRADLLESGKGPNCK